MQHFLQEYQLENMATELEKGYLALKPVIDMLEQLNRQENERADKLSGEIKKKKIRRKLKCSPFSPLF